MQQGNLLQIFDQTVQRQGSLPCFRYKEEGVWKSLNWNEVRQKIFDIVGGLKKLGVKKGDRVSIFSPSRYEWTLADMAILSCGAITVPIYESSTSEACEYILDNAGVKVVFVDGQNQFLKIKKVLDHLPGLKQIIIFEAVNGEYRNEGVYTLDQLMLLGSGLGEAVFKEMEKTLDEESLASYVYTSGTTGPPKGAMLTHGNFLSEILAVGPVFSFLPHHVSLLFLPLAHIFARAVQFAQLKSGFIQCYAESIDKLLDNITEVKPNLMASVPRIFEKVHTRVMQGVAGASETKKKIFYWALKVGEERSLLRKQKKSPSLFMRLKGLLAHKLVFSKLHAKMGGQLHFFISGGAPLSTEIAEFFDCAGFLILEGYGLTETSAAVTCNSPGAYKIGSVGLPLEGVSLKIADDGEILVRGGMIFKGYYNKPEDTAQILTSNGWFHTGDIGVVDQEGFLKITDRKKDIIVTAGGKNIAPQNIENLIKTDPYISQVMVHGDKRKFLSALVTLDQAEIFNYAKAQKIQFQGYDDLVKNDKIYHLIKNRIEEKNKQLAKYESIKKFAILSTDFSIETGELTPTMKVKRKFTSEKYKAILDEFYQE